MAPGSHAPTAISDLHSPLVPRFETVDRRDGEQQSRCMYLKTVPRLGAGRPRASRRARRVVDGDAVVGRDGEDVLPPVWARAQERPQEAGQISAVALLEDADRVKGEFRRWGADAGQVVEQLPTVGLTQPAPQLGLGEQGKQQPRRVVRQGWRGQFVERRT